MSIEQFWRNMKLAKRELESLDHVYADGQSSPRRLSLDLWLIPQTVEGFDPHDFSFLPDDQRRELEAAVQRFKEHATKVNADRRPARPEERDRGKADILRIAGLVGLDVYADADDYRVAKILERCKAELEARGLPVVDLLHRIEVDSTGEEALWVWVIVPDALADSDQFFEQAERIREELKQLLQKWRVDYWAHVEFWAESERDEEGAD